MAVTVVLAVAGVAAFVASADSGSGAAAPAATRQGNCHAVELISVRGSGDNSGPLGKLGTRIDRALATPAKRLRVD